MNGNRLFLPDTDTNRWKRMRTDLPRALHRHRQTREVEFFNCTDVEPTIPSHNDDDLLLSVHTSLYPFKLERQVSVCILQPINQVPSGLNGYERKQTVPA